MMKLSQMWWLAVGNNKVKLEVVPHPLGHDSFIIVDGETYTFKKNDAILNAKTYTVKVFEGSEEFFFYTSGAGNGFCLFRHRENNGKKIEWRPLAVKYERKFTMANKVIVNGIIVMLSDPSMVEKWTAISKNCYKFADITVSPTEMKFDGQVLKLTFSQRMKFLRAFGSLQEYHHVKKFRDSVAAALESCRVRDDDEFRSGM